MRIFFILMLCYQSVFAAVKYYNNPFGNVLRNASSYSATLTTISCGHPVTLIREKSSRWSYVKVGAYKGYVSSSFLSSTRPRCFQDKYPRFFEKFELDIAEYYYWGKLYNQYVQGKSKVR